MYAGGYLLNFSTIWSENRSLKSIINLNRQLSFCKNASYRIKSNYQPSPKFYPTSHLCVVLHLLIFTDRKGRHCFQRCLSTIGVIDTGSLLGLVTVRSVRILQECFLVIIVPEKFFLHGVILCMNLSPSKFLVLSK